MTVKDAFVNNPIKAILASSGSVIAIVAALFTVDARYAHAADVEKDKVQTQRIIQQTSATLRKQMLEDKLFELDVKQASAKDQKLAPAESAMKERYERQLREITAVERELAAGKTSK